MPEHWVLCQGAGGTMGLAGRAGRIRTCCQLQIRCNMIWHIFRPLKMSHKHHFGFLFVLFLKLELGHIQAPDLQCWIHALSWSSLGSQLFGFMQLQNRWPERIRAIKDVLANLGLLFFLFLLMDIIVTWLLPMTLKTIVLKGCSH